MRVENRHKHHHQTTHGIVIHVAMSVCEMNYYCNLDAEDCLAYYRTLKRCHMTHAYKGKGFHVQPHEARDFADACKRAGIEEEVRCLHDDTVASEVDAFRKAKEAEVEAFRKIKEAEVESFRKAKEAERKASWTADVEDGLKDKDAQLLNEDQCAADSSVNIAKSSPQKVPQILFEDSSVMDANPCKDDQQLITDEEYAGDTSRLSISSSGMPHYLFADASKIAGSGTAQTVMVMQIHSSDKDDEHKSFFRQQKHLLKIINMINQ